MKHILIVDDNPTNLRLASSVLELEGYEIGQAVDAEEALACLRDRVPDLILMDIWLPGMDGLSLTRKLKTDPRLKDVPVVALTAFAMKGDEEKAREAGCAGYITKPIDTREFPRQVAAYFREANVPLRLLIVDDNDTNLRLLRAQLEAEDHAVMEARNGVEALQVLDSGEFDGVVSDILMPRMDGYRLSLEVRKSQRFHSLPFVLYTSTYNSPADRDLARAAGADAYIEKPAPVESIIAAIRAAAGRARPAVLAEAAEAIEAPVLKQYSEVLIRKLEERSAELARANDGLAQTEARLSGLISSAFDAIIATDSAQRIILFNAAAEKMFGCSSSQAFGVAISRFFPTESASAPADEPGRHGNELRQGTRIAWAHRADGTTFPVEASVSTLETSRGAIHTAVIRDITQRYRSEQALARSEAGLRQAQLLARLGHVVTGPDGAFESWSESLPGLLDIPPERMPSTTRQWLEFIHPEDRERFRACAIEAGRTGERHELEYRLRRGNEWIHVRQVLAPAPEGFESQRPQRWLNTLQDVSAQKRAELRIRSQNRMLSVLSSINALIARATATDELLREACRIAVEVGEFSLCWIGLIDDKKIRCAAGFGGPPEYYTALHDRLAGFSIDERGFLPAAIRRLQPVIVNDLSAHPEDFKLALESGSRSLATLPLVIGGRAMGAVVLHAAVRGFFDTAEMDLLRDLAGDISFALDHLQKSQQIEYLANYDGLTELPNRRLFSERLAVALREHDADRAMLAVAFIDLDRLRRINETLGRAAGDELLKQVSARLNAANPTAARIGIDVFAVKIRDKRSAADIARAVEEILLACFNDPFRLAGDELRIGVRAGVAVFPMDGTEAEALLNNAEAALRKAKSSAERYVFYGRELNARAAEALNLETRLRRAIERQEFVLHYQPKLALADRRIAGAEALIRWRDPERGLVAPGEFISVLEESGLIAVIGEWVLRQAMADQRSWRDAGVAPPRVAVNVSPLQLRRPEFGDLIADVIAGSAGGELELEVTESVIMENVERIVVTLERIRACGVSVAIDDFGTGYSSLSYIARLPVTTLKIDRAFVVNMTETPEGMAIVSSIIALAHALKLSAVAEGIETEDQAQLLRLLGCDEGQGFLFSRAVSSADFVALLQSQQRSQSSQPG